MKYSRYNLNEAAKDIHDWNVEVGWWDDPNRSLGMAGCLISTEIAEAVEGLRKDKMDDHLPHRKMVEVELADALIRTLDIGAHLNLSVSERFSDDEAYFACLKDISQITDKLNNPQARFGFAFNILFSTASDFTKSLAERDFRKEEDNSELELLYNTLILSTLFVAYLLGENIFTAMELKLEYNKTRLDHKRQERQKEGGKKF